MAEAAPEKWIRLQPRLSGGETSCAPFVEHAHEVMRAQSEEDPEARSTLVRKAADERLAEARAWPSADRTRISAAIRVLSDLALQRWRVRILDGHVEVCLPADLRSDPAAEKARVRRQELIKRDEQLRTGAVRKFIEEMERSRLHGKMFVSIFSLMRDGRELASSLREARRLPLAQREPKLRDVVDPYLQFVSEDARCEHTGLRLQDIWRYFRHTWANQYTSVPGRNMTFLVRDSAASMHPVVGIGALGSPIVQIKERDAWIGWHPTAFFEQAEEAPTAELGEWLRRITETALEELYVDDLLEEQVIAPHELRHPTETTVKRLSEFGLEQRKLHHRYVRAQEHKQECGSARAEDPIAHWVGRARTHLFRSKRALTLADLLRARIAFDRHLGSSPNEDGVTALLSDREGRRAAAKILRKTRADHVGIAMADITVCGAVAPYNPILGGKLIAMLAASPEVVETYRRRYGAAESEIASSMAGRPIVRPADLVFLGTTSLYGVGSSQYNRVRIPATRLGGDASESIEYLELGSSEAFGTSHYSSETVQLLVDLVHHSNGGQRVNSIFGEGVSPKLRKVREGLDELGFPSDHLLRHGRSRIIYGVSLARNMRDYLLDMESVPDYLFSTGGQEGTAAVGVWWRERWLARRIDSDAVLEDVQRHTLVRPIRHGARVSLPKDSSGQLALFEDL